MLGRKGLYGTVETACQWVTCPARQNMMHQKYPLPNYIALERNIPHCRGKVQKVKSIASLKNVGHPKYPPTALYRTAEDHTAL